MPPGADELRLTATGVVGAADTASDAGALVPQPFCATTCTVPLPVAAVAAMLLVEEEPVHPEGSVQM